MFAKNVFGSRLESNICKTKNACVRLCACARGTHSPSCPLFPRPPTQGQGNGQRGGCLSLTRKISIIINLIYYYILGKLLFNAFRNLSGYFDGSVDDSILIGFL